MPVPDHRNQTNHRFEQTEGADDEKHQVLNVKLARDNERLCQAIIRHQWGHRKGAVVGSYQACRLIKSQNITHSPEALPKLKHVSRQPFLLYPALGQKIIRPRERRYRPERVYASFSKACPCHDFGFDPSRRTSFAMSVNNHDSMPVCGQRLGEIVVDFEAFRNAYSPPTRGGSRDIGEKGRIFRIG
jgi:hypothetical protein